MHLENRKRKTTNDAYSTIVVGYQESTSNGGWTNQIFV